MRASEAACGVEMGVGNERMFDAPLLTITRVKILTARSQIMEASELACVAEKMHHDLDHRRACKCRLKLQ
jgi:hypothetical protein